MTAATITQPAPVMLHPEWHERSRPVVINGHGLAYLRIRDAGRGWRETRIRCVNQTTGQVLWRRLQWRVHETPCACESIHGHGPSEGFDVPAWTDAAGIPHGRAVQCGRCGERAGVSVFATPVDTDEANYLEYLMSQPAARL